MDRSSPSRSAQAVRVDERAGLEESASFFGPGPDRTFGVLHAPLGAARGAAVICSPAHAEFERNYRSEVLLGRELASRGVAAQRFHYRGMGHSDGDPAKTTFDTMVADALSASERVLEETGHERCVFVGTRWGALVAAAASARSRGSTLALWQPTLRAEEHFKSAFRVRGVRGLRKGDGTGERPLDDLRRTGVVDVVGYGLWLALYDSALGRTLETEAGDEPRRVLLVQIAKADELRPDYEALAVRWRERGFDVDARAFRGEEGWWFGTIGERWQPEMNRTDRDLLRVTADWIATEVER